MSFRWFPRGIGKRATAVARVSDELTALRSRLSGVEASLRARERAEQFVRQRAAPAEAEVEAAWRQVRALTEQLTASEEALSRERNRTKAAEAKAAESDHAVVECAAARAEIAVALEQERLRRRVVEEALRAQCDRFRQRDLAVQQQLAGLRETLAAARTQLAEQHDRIAQLTGTLHEALSRTEKPPEPDQPPSPADNGQHLRFFATTTGYELAPVDGPAPEPGAVVALGNGAAGVVLKIGPSPLPSDGRRCVYVEICPSPT